MHPLLFLKNPFIQSPQMLNYLVSVLWRTLLLEAEVQTSRVSNRLNFCRMKNTLTRNLVNIYWKSKKECMCMLVTLNVCECECVYREENRLTIETKACNESPPSLWEAQQQQHWVCFFPVTTDQQLAQLHESTRASVWNSDAAATSWGWCHIKLSLKASGFPSTCLELV